MLKFPYMSLVWFLLCTVIHPRVWSIQASVPVKRQNSLFKFEGVSILNFFFTHTAKIKSLPIFYPHAAAAAALITQINPNIIY